MASQPAELPPGAAAGSTSSNSPWFVFQKKGRKIEMPFESNVDVLEFHQLSLLTKAHQDWTKPGIFSKLLFKVLFTLLLMSVIYFALVGYPFWTGAVLEFWYVMHDQKHSTVWAMLAFFVWGSILPWIPQLFCTFEKKVDDPEKRDNSECCLVIPCYKSAEALKQTLPAALKIFRPEQIFVVANGNSPVPLDHTADVCNQFGVEHTWVPVGSKIVAEFVGVQISKKYKYCMLIDDDCLLPADMPLPTDRFKDNVACIGYTIKSVGENSSRGTLIQQAQDIEYKLAGLSKVFQSWYGSATFPHGAVALWSRKILNEVFHGHPGYHISEDWYLGHTARCLGYRVVMCSQVFVETETPPALLFGGGGRGGYGEMTVFKQRFHRWNFFYTLRIFTDSCYLLFAWRLGWREAITKLFVFVELYHKLLMLLSPLIAPVLFATSWKLTLIVTGILLGVTLLAVVFFNLVHLRRKGQMFRWYIIPVFFVMKLILLPINIVSMYYNLIKYLSFFSKKQLRVTENVEAWRAIRYKLAELNEKDGVHGWAVRPNAGNFI
ncbi:hypothetical protein GQ53DRAFT_783587 [Thozetella sp. PMI_491]|nr:hypothetical protein GQ53DRAFT_783587 [Thozetella sp. PMI_491]